MTITLDPDQEAWHRARVASGDFASVEAAARQLLGARIAELDNGEDSDDVSWAKPYLDEGRRRSIAASSFRSKSIRRTTRRC